MCAASAPQTQETSRLTLQRCTLKCLPHTTAPLHMAGCMLTNRRAPSCAPFESFFILIFVRSERVADTRACAVCLLRVAVGHHISVLAAELCKSDFLHGLMCVCGLPFSNKFFFFNLLACDCNHDFSFSLEQTETNFFLLCYFCSFVGIGCVFSSLCSLHKQPISHRKKKSMCKYTCRRTNMRNNK